jgi:hypothetical protein
MRNHVKALEKKKKKVKTKKDFNSYFSAQERQFLVGYPIFKAGGFSILNLPTMHFKIHIFDFLKKLNYQMNSRKFTGSDKCVAEIQALRGKEKVEKYKIQKQQCRNPKCRQFCKGYIFLKTHVMKKSQPKNCKLFYTRANNLDELVKTAETELKFMRKIAKQTLLQNHLDTVKKNSHIMSKKR